MSYEISPCARAAPKQRKTQWRSRRRKYLGLFVIGIIICAEGLFFVFIMGYFASHPSAINPNPTYDLNVPIRFNYYYYKTADYNGTPNFVFGIWLRGKTQVDDTILAGQSFTMAARADQSNSSSPLKDTRMIEIFFQDSLAASPMGNDSDLLPRTDVIVLCQDGDCICTAPSTCYLPIHPNSTVENSQYFWTTVSGTFYFPISGSYSPVIRFLTIGPLNQTYLLATVTGPDIGGISLNVDPASFAQEAYIANANLILTIAIFIFGAIESFEVGSKILKWAKESP